MKRWILALLVAIATVTSTLVVMPTAAYATSQNYNPRFLDQNGNPVTSATVTIWNLGDPHDGGHILYTGTTDSLGYLTPAVSLVVGNSYYFQTTSSSVPSGQFVAPSPQTVVVVPANGGLFLDTSGVAQTKTGSLAVTGGITLGVALPVGSGGSGSTSYTASTCIRANTTPILVSAGGDCTVLSPGSQQTGALNVSSTIRGDGGFFTNSATALTMGATTANSLTSNATGTNVDAFVLNAVNGSPPTGNLLNLQVGGVSKATVNIAGAGTFTNLTDSAIGSGQCVQTTTGGELIGTGVACGPSAITSLVAGTNVAITAATGPAATINVINNPTFSGTVTISASNPLALSGTTANSITSNTTGAVDAFVFNTINGTAPTGHLVNWQAGGSSVATLSMAGALVAQSLTASGITSGQCLQSGTAGIITGTGSVCSNLSTKNAGTVTYLLTDALNGANGSPNGWSSVSLGSDGNYYAVRMLNSTGPVIGVDKIAPASGGNPPTVTTSNSFTDGTRFTSSTVDANIVYVSGGPNVYLLTYNGGANQDYVVKLTTALAETAEFTIPITSCNPRNLVTDGTNVYFFCSNASNYYLYKMVPTGTFTNLATVPQEPGTMVYDSGSGDLWITTASTVVGSSAAIYKYTTAGSLSATYTSSNVTGLPSNASHASYAGIAFDGSGLPWVIGNVSTTVAAFTSVFKLNSNTPTSATAYASGFSTTVANGGGMSLGLQYGGDGNMYAPFYDTGNAANCVGANCFGTGVAQINTTSGAYTFELDDRIEWSTGPGFPDLGPWNWAVASNVLMTGISSTGSNAFVVTTPMASFTGQTVKQAITTFSNFCVAATTLQTGGGTSLCTSSPVTFANGGITFTGWNTVACTLGPNNGSNITTTQPVQWSIRNLTTTGFTFTNSNTTPFMSTADCWGY